MSNKYEKLLLVMLPVLMLLCWVGFLSLDRHSGQEVVVSIGGYDPRSVLSGHYIEYQIDWDNTDCFQFEDNVCPKKDFMRIMSYRDLGWVQGPGGRFQGFGGGRFYVSEKSAEALDKAVRNSDNKAEIVYSYKKGRRPYALRLLINGQSFQSRQE